MEWWNDLSLDTDLIPAIDRTETRSGRLRLRERLHNLETDPQILRNRDTESTLDPRLRQMFTEGLKAISKREGDIYFFLSTDDSDRIPALFAPWDILNQPGLLDGYHLIKIYLSAVILLMYLIVYLVLRIKGIKLSPRGYLRQMVVGWVDLADRLVSMLIPSHDLSHYCAVAGVHLYALFQLAKTYSGIDGAISHAVLLDRYRRLIRRADEVVSVVEVFHTHRPTDHSIGEVISRLKSELTTSLGESILLRRSSRFRRDFQRLIDYYGDLDVELNRLKLLESGYSTPTWIDDHRPTLRLSRLFHPKLKNQIKNDLIFVAPNQLLTGANATGKSTLMRAVMISVILAQSIGVVPAESAWLTPFSSIGTYLNIPDQIGRESVYEAEVRRCREYLDRIEQLPPDQFSLTIVDEMFTGTNPIEGFAASYAVLKQLSGYKNSLSIVATHYHDLSRLIDNRRFEAICFPKPYHLASGVSRQRLAISMLEEHNFPRATVETARRVIDEYEKRLSSTHSLTGKHLDQQTNDGQKREASETACQDSGQGPEQDRGRREQSGDQSRPVHASGRREDSVERSRCEDRRRSEVRSDRNQRLWEVDSAPSDRRTKTESAEEDVAGVRLSGSPGQRSDGVRIGDLNEPNSDRIENEARRTPPADRG